jgi:hypothetical protein
MTSDALDLDCQCDACTAFFPSGQLDAGHAVVVLVRGASEYRCGACAAAPAARASGVTGPGTGTDSE